MTICLLNDRETMQNDSKDLACKKVIILGSGGLRIGQAGEFDYSGSQAIKALKQEGFEVILVNPNIATVQTDPGLADRVYLQPLNLETVTAIIEKEKPGGILLGFGGQTALNLGLALNDEGVLERFQLPVLGTPVSSIKITEDRELFKKTLDEIDVHTARSIAVSHLDEAIQAAQEIGYPIMLRSGYSLGGQGSGVVRTDEELKQRASEALSSAPQILIEEYLDGWKEIEYEVMRDSENNCITICNMENMDPMGIHTGESIVVAPSQTLTNDEYHLLREVAIKTVRHLGIVGECNIQYALDPETSDYRVIEVNARLSRSSALASKATGYPIAYIAAKLAIGRQLYQLRNEVTQKTSAFFEPALDYIVVKMPRWDIQKFKSADRKIGSEMKSVGEVMAIGRTFPEALQKAIRMLNIGLSGIDDYTTPFESLEEEILNATDRRLYAIYQYLLNGGEVEEVHKISKIDPWFLFHINTISEIENRLKKEGLSTDLLLQAKKQGFSDRSIAKHIDQDEEFVREKRRDAKMRPVIKQIDTLAAEFKAQTNYLYTTYWGDYHDIAPSGKSPVIVLGSGPYCIGSSVEFDWCAVNAIKGFRQAGKEAIMINSNPETVSTDYDESDRLYFEELSFERVADIAEFESPMGIVVSVGGQIANNLAIPLDRSGFPLLGTPAKSIDRAEDRQKFSTLLNELNVDQPAWTEVKSLQDAKEFIKKVKYPVLVRPSYVLSGAAMNVVFSDRELEKYLSEATDVSKGHPVVISQFIQNAKELEIDGVADRGNIVVEAITEHVENAGVHSGDATLVIPPQRLYLETIRRAKDIARKIIAALGITGPFNIQFIAKDNVLKVIECNVRASRSFPFVSKVTNVPYMEIVTQVLLGMTVKKNYETLELNCVGVKTPQFSYHRLKGANPVAQVEMASTGEVACLGDCLEEAFFQSWLATEQKIRGKSLLVSIGGDRKGKFLEALRALEAAGWELSATEHTHDFLVRNGIGSRFLYKASEKLEPNVKTVIARQEVDLIINIPNRRSWTIVTDGYIIRRLAIDHHIPLITNLQLALLFLQCLNKFDQKKIPVKSLNEFMTKEVYANLVSTC